MELVSKFFKSFVSLYMIPIFICGCFLFVTFWLGIISSFFILLFYIIYFRRQFKKKILDEQTLYYFGFIVIIINLALLVAFILSQGDISSPSFGIFYLFAFPFFAYFSVTSSLGVLGDAILWLEALLLLQFIICCCLVKPKISVKKITIISTVFLLMFTADIYLYKNRPEIRYAVHGFNYMNGYSSTDLSDYSPYADNSKLVTLKEPSTLIIDNEEDMPILDGAEACYPVYSAIAKTVYKNIDSIEKNALMDGHYSSQNGKIVTFTNSSIGYDRLFRKESDIFFGAKPSLEQLEEAKEQNVELDYTAIGKEGFVFFVNKDNPIDNLTTDQVKSIYHGDITNWKDVGGKDEEITAFQRPERSGSQSMMVSFMGKISLKEPMTYEVQTAMLGIIEEVAQYHNESGAIGYTFRYFLEGLNQEKDVKMISIDGIKPTTENIKNQSYPISTYLYCVTLKSNQDESVKKLRDYLLSNQGQYIIEQTGYCALN